MSAVRVLEWRPLQKGALLGFAKVEMPSGMVIAEVTIMRGERGEWASPPSKPLVGRDGTAMKDAGGKPRYVPLVSFTSKELRDRFSTAVIEALRTTHPEAFS
jgi:DNA-binding cell septation regulator SpoVG